MLNRIKSALLPLVVLTLLITNPLVAVAQTFSDVTVDAWHHGYIEQLVQEGIVDAGDSYRPNDALTRAELAKMVIEATDGLAEFEVPVIPTFSDVAVDAWYYDYVEAAAEFGIFDGYKDDNGNKTGMFGPEDMVTRAAATKALSKAFAIPGGLEAESVFPDVTRGYWYYDYVVGVYKGSIADGYENGNFGPTDYATRAQIAKLIVNAMNPVERLAEIKPVAAGVEDVFGEEVIVSEESGLVVSLTPVQTPSYTLPIASTGPLLNLDLTATGSDVFVSGIALTRSGVGAASDWYAIYAYESSFKITSEYTVARNTNKVSIPMKVFVKGGTTTTLSFYGSSDVVAQPLNQHIFSLESAADIITDAQTVSGDYPLSGTQVTFGSQLTNTLTIVPGISLSKPERDQHSEIASFKLTAGASGDVGVKVLLLTQGGTFSSSKMTDCSLFRSDELVAKAAGFYQDQLIFVPETPYFIPSGQNRNFYVECYINGGRSTDTIQLHLEETYDLITVHGDYGFAAVPLNGYTRTLAPSYGLKPISMIIQ